MKIVEVINKVVNIYFQQKKRHFLLNSETKMSYDEEHKILYVYERAKSGQYQNCKHCKEIKGNGNWPDIMKAKNF